MSKLQRNRYAVFNALQEKQGTVADVAARLDLAQHVVLRWVQRMHEGAFGDEHRVHICGWYQSAKNNRWCPVYATGLGEDALLTAVSLGKRAYYENYMAKLRKDRARLAEFKYRKKIAWDRYAAKQKAKKWVDKHLTQGVQDPLLAAFYGMRTSA